LSRGKPEGAFTDDERERQFKEGMRAIMDAIDEEGVYA